MTLNILFVTITVKMRKKSAEQYLNNERVERLYDEMMTKQASQAMRMF